MNAELLIAVAVGLAASIEDLVRRKISNWIPVSAFAAGVICLAVTRGWRGVASAMGGALGGFVVFLIFYWLGGMGGGDVKLMAGFGAVLGIERVLAAALWTAACGGMIAALYLAWVQVRNRIARRNTEGGAAPEAIPYAPAIALGTWLALLPKT